jgi:hypothetical protein
LIDFEMFGVETHRQNADCCCDLGLVMRLSELRWLGTIGNASVERHRLCRHVVDLVHRAVRLENQKFVIRSFAPFTRHVQNIIPPVSAAISAGIFNFDGNGISGRHHLSADQL